MALIPYCTCHNRQFIKTLPGDSLIFLNVFWVHINFINKFLFWVCVCARLCIYNLKPAKSYRKYFYRHIRGLFFNNENGALMALMTFHYAKKTSKISLINLIAFVFSRPWNLNTLTKILKWRLNCFSVKSYVSLKKLREKMWMRKKATRT